MEILLQVSVPTRGCVSCLVRPVELGVSGVRGLRCPWLRERSVVASPSCHPQALMSRGRVRRCAVVPYVCTARWVMVHKVLP